DSPRARSPSTRRAPRRPTRRPVRPSPTSPRPSPRLTRRRRDAPSQRTARRCSPSSRRVLAASANSTSGRGGCLPNRCISTELSTVFAPRCILWNSCPVCKSSLRHAHANRHARTSDGLSGPGRP
ncbi:hypothetical protein EMIHUDRAFT_349990, partial [Emiliania huxleyi CCMP1516]|uniref:Uncharacterized protein n=2 Tax=Emiliania huxleyi TaxID=2903 RepID=A0A0D3J495_EMIH1